MPRQRRLDSPDDYPHRDRDRIESDWCAGDSGAGRGRGDAFVHRVADDDLGLLARRNAIGSPTGAGITMSRRLVDTLRKVLELTPTPNPILCPRRRPRRRPRAAGSNGP